MGCTKLAACTRGNRSRTSTEGAVVLNSNQRIPLGCPIPDLWPNGLHPKLKRIIRFIALNYDTSPYHTEMRLSRMPSIWWGDLNCNENATAAECFARFLNFLHSLPYPVFAGSLETWRKAYNWMLIYRHQCNEVSDLAAIQTTKELIATMHAADQEFAKYIIAMLYTITYDSASDKFRYKQLEKLVKEIRPYLFDFSSTEEVSVPVNVSHLTRNICYFMVEKADKIFMCNMEKFIVDDTDK